MHDYEVEIEHNNLHYLVLADLDQEGTYEEDSEWLDITSDPVFYNYLVLHPEDFSIDSDTEGAIIKKATQVLNNVYWDRTLT